MRRVALLAACALALVVAPAAAQDPPPPADLGPCADPAVLCPDLVVDRPRDVAVLRSRRGRALLGSRNRLVNRGDGPLALSGRRIGARTMRVTQRLSTVRGSPRLLALDRARFDFWPIPGQGRFWKLRDALSIELLSRDGERVVRRSPKTRFCMRDLLRAPGTRGPRGRIFPGCSQNDRARTVRMGVSRGWVESYPAFYHEQSIDVTGLRGCYILRHTADPLGNVAESDETNNIGQRSVRLPARGRNVRRC